MNKENPSFDEKFENEAQTLASPEEIENSEEMSEVSSLVNIFYNPRKTFQAMRKKPRFLLAGLIIIIGVGIFNGIAIQKVGLERIVLSGIESDAETKNLPKEQKDAMVAEQTAPLAQAINYVAPPIVVLIIILAGGLIYKLAANAVGGSAKWAHGISAWVYSGLPPSILIISTNIILLFLKSSADIDPATVQNGFVDVSPTFFIDGKLMPVLAAFLSSIDLIIIWSWTLAAIGLRRVANISSFAAWAIVLGLASIGIVFKVVGTIFFN